MKKLLVPGIKLINKLKYPQKLSLISLLIFLFIAALLTIIILGLDQKIAFINKQRTGIMYIDPAKDLLHNIEEHRALLRINTLNQYNGITREIAELEFFINRDLAQIKRVNKEHNDIFGISGEIKEISQTWDYLMKNASSLSEEKIFRQNNLLIQKVYKLIIKIGDNSNLSLSPQIHTFYLAQSIIWDVPLLAHKIGKIRSIGSAALAKKILTEEQKLQIIIYINFLRASLEGINNNSNKIFKEKEKLQNTFREPLLEMNNTIQSFLSMTYHHFIEDSKSAADPKTFLSSGTKAIRSTSKLYHMKIALLDDLLKKETRQIKRLKLIIIFPAVLILLGIAYIFACFTFSVVSGVKYLKSRAMQVAEGDLNIRSELKTEDELKYLSDSLNTMVSSFKNLIKREKIIKDIVVKALESTDIKETSSSIVKSTAKLFEADRCFFVEYDAKAEVFAPIEKQNCYISSIEVRDIIGMRLSKEVMKPITDYVFLKKKVLAVDDTSKLDFPDCTMELIRKCKVKSFMAAPLFYASEPIGLLLVQSIKKSRKYKEDDIKLMESISYQSSIAINQARLMDQIKRKSEEIEAALSTERTLRKITTESSLCKTHEEIDNYILNELSSIFNVNKVVHLHVDRNALQWYGSHAKDGKAEIMERQCFVPSDSGREITPAPEEVLVFNNVDEEVSDKYLKKCLDIEGIKSLIAYPTSKKFPGRREKGVIEVTIIACSKPRTWSNDEKNLFTVIMDTLSIVTLETIQRRELEETRKTFISTLTHDLRSPLIAEQKVLEFLLSPKGSKIDPSEYLEDIYKTNEDLLKLINNLLSSYQYESGKWKLNKTRENLEKLIKKVISSLTLLAAEKDDEILLELPKTLPEIDIDVIEIKRLLINLITNAIKHNDKGIKITISAKKAGKQIQVSVSDNGNGIPQELQSKIFLKYTSRKGQIGTGLGLYISKQIVEAHEGKIWFDTEVGKGTTFYFTLPLE